MAEYQTGLLIRAVGGFYYVKTDGAVYECKARGSFRKSGVSPLVGDRAEMEKTSDTSGVINKILPRKNATVRPAVANIDKLFIVSSFVNPPPNAFLTDKMTVIARYNNMEPVIVFNKCDMGDFSNWRKIYEKSGFKVYVISAKEKIGIKDLKTELKDCVSAFTGNSGVGKSSLLNAVFGENLIATGEVSEKLGRGRHTTRHTQLYPLPFGGFVADTPGFSSFELDTSDFSLKEKLADCFWDFAPFSANCRFADCTHTKESGCAVLEAVSAGDIEPTRHASYLQLFDGMKDLKPWQNKK